jgi:hypothetical protein
MMDCGEGRGDTHLRRHRGERVVAEQPAACGHARTVEHNNIIIAKGQLGVGSEGESESSQEGAALGFNHGAPKKRTRAAGKSCGQN